MTPMFRLTLGVMLLSGCLPGHESIESDDALADHGVCDVSSSAAAALCRQVPNNGWRRALAAEFSQPYFAQLAEAVEAARAADADSDNVEDSVYPAEADVFAALRRTRPSRVRAVIVGQDPYFNEDQAMGLSFSVPSGVAVPPSLRTIFRELRREATDPTLRDEFPSEFACPSDGDLTAWADNGVLLLNAMLTVRHGKAGSHRDMGWEHFTDAILRIVDARAQRRPVAFLLWGQFARRKAPLLTESESLLILTSNHPSPLATGFLGNGHFAAANAFLAAHDATRIDWALPSDGDNSCE